MCIETEEELLGLREAGRVAHACLRAMEERVAAGITTAELDRIGAAVMEREGARPAPALVYGFPAAVCISVNDEVVHGIPSARRLQSGDLVKLDVTVEKNGFMADTAITVPVGTVSATRRDLIECAQRAFAAGLAQARAGRRLRQIGRAIEREVRARGFWVVRGLSGHGIGRSIHEPPTVPNFDDPEATGFLRENLVITIEPLIAIGGGEAYEDADRWTVRTAEGGAAAHHEHTIVVTRGEPIVLTAA
jgi:methionyl aminopeptidase